MAWRDQLQAGTFRGVPFEFEGGDSEIGRRVALHEYPLRDKPWAEDLGRKAREFTLDVFVIGDDYMTGRDALIAAVEAPGSGTLVHPRFGNLQVTVTSCRGPRESTREGGMARFSITFVETGDKVFPGDTPDTRVQLQSQAAETRTALQTTFGEEFSTAAVPSFVVDDARTLTTELFDRLANLTALSPTIPSAVTTYLAQIDRAKSLLASLVMLPTLWASTIGALFPAATRTFSHRHGELRALRTLSSFGTTRQPVPQTTATRARQITNRAAIDSFARRNALINETMAISEITFSSFNEAVAVREYLAGRLDVEMLTAADDDYVALTDLRVAVVRDITARSADLARIVQYRPNTTLPSLVVAYQLYGDIGAEADILARNRVRHPGFIPGDQPLEVLTNAA